MKTAVILAAGKGSRLRDAVHGIPKGFLKLGKQSIVEESIARLIDAGIEDIVVVTGHHAEFYDALAAQHSGLIRTAHNPKFASSGSMYSLFCTRELLNAPFLLLESDLIYEKRALEILLKHASADAILLAGNSNAGDEVFVQTRGGFLESMSKVRAELNGEIAGELVGISKISPSLFKRMIEISEKAFSKTLMFDYETDCLVAAGKTMDIPCPLVDDLIWAEIDDPRHLARAQSKIYPAILTSDSSRSLA